MSDESKADLRRARKLGRTDMVMRALVTRVELLTKVVEAGERAKVELAAAEAWMAKLKEE